ncbi:MAG: hypothetical protein M1832_003330 [Thelocarpon impressellum]|nr:MAG: hypothetical protein M1832_003330 [Thelocarpon impressellum]
MDRGGRNEPALPGAFNVAGPAPQHSTRPMPPVEAGTKRSIDMAYFFDPAKTSSQVAGQTLLQLQTQQPPLKPPGGAPRPRLRASSNKQKVPPGHTPAAPRAQQTPKVAIPRLNRDSDVASGSGPFGDKHRVSHACEPCRSRKTKCTGGRPECEHCKEYRLHCYYADGKRDRAKKEMGNLQERIDEYEQLLRQLSIRGDSATQLAIQKALEKFPLSDDEDRRALTGARRGRHSLIRDEIADDGDGVDGGDGGDDRERGEDVIGAEVGSTGSMDRVNQDFGRDEESANAGYFGKTSDVAWINRARNEAFMSSTNEERDAGNATSGHRSQGLHPSPPAVSDHPNAFETRPSTYYLEDEELSVPKRLDELALPPRSLADALVGAYFTTIQPSFPLLSKTGFFEVYERWFRAYGEPIGRRWRAILNLVFAIGAKYCVLTRSGWCEERDHLVFFSRARALSLDNGSLWDVGDLEQVQVMGLTALYLTASNHVNRAWCICGLAIRYAQALGLHLRNESKQQDMSDVRKEREVRVWWSLYSLESLLVVMTGRPSAISDRDISSVLPVPIDEESFPAYHADKRRLYDDDHGSVRPPSLPTEGSSEVPSPPSSTLPTPAFSTPLSLPQPLSFAAAKSAATAATSLSPPGPPTPPVNAALYLVHRVKLNILTHQICSDLYTVEAVNRSWSATQKDMESYNTKLDRWLAELPGPFNFRHAHRDQTFARERMALGMLFWSTRIVLARPCLCKLDGQIPHESSVSKVFNRRTAAGCVHAASELLRLLPDAPDPPGLYAVAPWWGLLHHLSQAASVIMLELAFTAYHVPREAARIFVEARKAVAWLRAMAEESLAADRAWHLLDGLLRRVAPKVGGDTSDMPQESLRAAPAAGSVTFAAIPDLAQVDAASWAHTTFDDAAAQAQAEAFSLWQQDQQQAAFFREFEAALGGSVAFSTAPGEDHFSFIEPPMFPQYGVVPPPPNPAATAQDDQPHLAGGLLDPGYPTTTTNGQ